MARIDDRFRREGAALRRDRLVPLADLAIGGSPLRLTKVHVSNCTESEMAFVKRLLCVAFLLVPAFSDAQTLGPDVTPKAFLQMIDRPRVELTPSQKKQREVNGIDAGISRMQRTRYSGCQVC
jgi:hypothetical protein